LGLIGLSRFETQQLRVETGVRETLGRQERALGGNRRQHDLDHRVVHLRDDL
jgi:hypothetical protein